MHMVLTHDLDEKLLKTLACIACSSERVFGIINDDSTHSTFAQPRNGYLQKTLACTAHSGHRLKHHFADLLFPLCQSDAPPLLENPLKNPEVTTDSILRTEWILVQLVTDSAPRVSPEMILARSVACLAPRAPSVRRRFQS